MWTPKEGAAVFWRTPGGRPWAETTFTNTGDRFPNTPEAFWARYANGRPVWVELPSQGNVAGTRAQLLEEGDHGGQSLGAALIRAAGDPNNPWGLEPRQLTGDMALLIHDFMATELGPERQDPRVLYPAPADLPQRPTIRPPSASRLEAQLREELAAVRGELGAAHERLDLLDSWAREAKSMKGFDSPHGRWWSALKEGVGLALRPLP